MSKKVKATENLAKDVKTVPAKTVNVDKLNLNELKVLVYDLSKKAEEMIANIRLINDKIKAKSK